MNPKKVLIAVDGSENSIRTLDYVRNIFGVAADAVAMAKDYFHFMLLYVESLPDRDLFPDEEAWMEKRRMEEERIRVFLREAESELRKKWPSGAEIATTYIAYEDAMKAGASFNVAHSILAAQQAGDYGTVVIGRRKQTKAQEFLFGSTTTKIIRDSGNCAIWVV